MSCPICSIHSSTIPFLLEKTNHWILRHTEPAKNCPGYLYLEPIIHIENFSEISAPASFEIGQLITKGSKWIQDNFSPKKIYTVTISEKVPHLHFHLVPRYADTPIGMDYLRSALNSELIESDFTQSNFQCLENTIEKYKKL